MERRTEPSLAAWLARREKLAEQSRADFDAGRLRVVEDGAIILPPPEFVNAATYNRFYDRDAPDHAHRAEPSVTTRDMPASALRAAAPAAPGAPKPEEPSKPEEPPPMAARTTDPDAEIRALISEGKLTGLDDHLIPIMTSNRALFDSMIALRRAPAPARPLPVPPPAIEPTRAVAYTWDSLPATEVEELDFTSMLRRVDVVPTVHQLAEPIVSTDDQRAELLAEPDLMTRETRRLDALQKRSAANPDDERLAAMAAGVVRESEEHILALNENDFRRVVHERREQTRVREAMAAIETTEPTPKQDDDWSALTKMQEPPSVVEEPQPTEEERLRAVERGELRLREIALAKAEAVLAEGPSAYFRTL